MRLAVLLHVIDLDALTRANGIDDQANGRDMALLRSAGGSNDSRL